MPICKTSTLLKMAQDNKYCVPAFNVYNYESIAWTLEVAEEMQRPVLIMVWHGASQLIPFSTIRAITHDLAKDLTVPVALHMDHSYSFESAMEGPRYGFNSTMYDGSTLPFDENVANTREVVKAAHAMGCEVEAELGHVGQGNNLADFAEGTGAFTNVDEMVKFIELTGVDALAVSIGNAHGAYAATPNLKLDLLKELRAATDIPLVMHGGSGIPAEQVQKAIGIGVAKMNIATDFWQAMYDSVKDSTEDAEKQNSFIVSLGAREQFKDFVRSRFEMLVGIE